MCVKPSKLQKINVPKVYLDGSSIELVSHYKYLGLTMCSNDKDDEAIASQIRGLYCRGNALIKHFKYCSENVKSQLFKTYCSSFYCSHLWSNCSTESLRRLKVAHNRIFRVLMGLEHRVSMSFMFIYHKVSHSSIILRNAMCGFIDRINNSDNHLISTVVSSNSFIDSKMSKQWNNSLNVMDM